MDEGYFLGLSPRISGEELYYVFTDLEKLEKFLVQMELTPFPDKSSCRCAFVLVSHTTYLY